MKVGLGGLSSGICSLFFIIGLIRIWLGFFTLSFTCERGEFFRQDVIFLSASARLIDGWMDGTDGMISHVHVSSWTASARWSHQNKLKLTAPISPLLEVTVILLRFVVFDTVINSLSTSILTLEPKLLV